MVPLPVSRWPKPSQSSIRVTPSADVGTSTVALCSESTVAVVWIQSANRLPVE